MQEHPDVLAGLKRCYLFERALADHTASRHVTSKHVKLRLQPFGAGPADTIDVGEPELSRVSRLAAESAIDSYESVHILLIAASFDFLPDFLLDNDREFHHAT